MAVTVCKATVPLQLVRARRFFQRLKGLIGRTSMGPDEAFLIERCGAVHTLGMHISIDLVFLSSDGIVLKVVEHVRPRRFVMCPKAKHVLELAEGAAGLRRIEVGMRAVLGRSSLSFDVSDEGGLP